MPVPVVLTILGNIAGAVLGKVADHLFAPIQRKFKYMCCFDSNITELEAQLEMFQRTRRGLQLRVDNDRANVRTIDPTVEAWLQSASEVTTEVEGITQEKPKVKEKCLNGWCPNLKLRYSLSRKAVKKTEEVVKLQAAAVSLPETSYSPPPTSKSFPETSYSPPPTSNETIHNRDFTGFESRRLNMEHVIEALRQDEIKLIGICGMGGTGKTTMVKEIAKKAKEESLFDEVAMVVVGQEPDPTNLQVYIAEMLGLKELHDKKNSIVRADLLRRRLLQDNKKILVILDDVWAEMDLEDMGFPLRGANKNFKMLYTSRTRYLWHNLQIIKEIPLELLSEDEAWQLFREKVGDLADARDLQPIAKKIANECGCLPLALVIIGSALSRKSKGNFIKDTWEDMLDQLTCARNTPPGNILSSSLELSYKYVEDEDAKRLFLLCCLFKEDEHIRIENLARYGFGLSLFDGINEMAKARRRVVVIVNDLKSRYLLIDSEFNECVKVHDVVRDMGISIASRDKPALVSHGALSEWRRKDNYEHYTDISVISEKIEELPEGLTYPNLEFLMLQSSKLGKLPPDFFEGMGKLKVLDLKYFLGILTFQPLRNLTTLSLEAFGGVLDNVCAIRDLVNLEILSFRYSEIKELPEEIGELVNLRLLDLDATRSLKRIPRGVISRLERLEELYVCRSGFKNWEGEGKENANLRELESLSNLNTLEIEILSNDIAPIFIPPIFGELKMYKVLIGELYRCLPWEFEPYKRLLAVSRSTPIPLYPLIPLLRSSDCLYLDGRGCNDLVRELLLRDGVDGLQQLKHLKISACDTPECLANTMNLFPILEKLYLWSLSYLRQICRGPVPTGSFRELTTLNVIKCGLLENLFELPIGGCFAQLKILTIKSCIMMKEVFRKQQRGDVPDATKRIEFPKLETLKLEDLPSLVGFCRGIDQIDFPKLKSMDLKSLGKFKRLFHNNNNLSSNSSQEDNFGFLSLFPQKVSLPNLEVLKISKLENQETLEQDLLSVGSLAKLKNISVRDCSKLLCVFPSQLVPMLQNLERLTIAGCHLLKVVFELEGVDTKEPNQEVLSALKVVNLHNLPKLIYISKGDPDPIGFKYVQTLRIDGCHSLRYVFAPTVGKSISQLRQLTIRGCEMLSRIVAEENRMGESTVDKVEFPWLEKLDLQDLPNLVSLFPNVNTALPKSTDSLQDPMQPQSLFNEKVSIPSLKYMNLLGLKNVSDLWCSELPGNSISKLQELKVTSCTSLRIVFHLSIAGGLVNLKKLLIHSCSTLEAVVGKEEEVKGGYEREIDKVEFPWLERLDLQDLPNLVSLFPNVNTALPKSTDSLHHPLQPQSLFNEKVSIPSLKYLKLHGLKNVSDLWCSELPSNSISKLEELKVISCTSLRIVFHLSIAGGLVNLKKLLIHFCSTLEAVVGKEEEVKEGYERKIHKVEFPRLERLDLQYLPNLVSFFPNVNTALPKSTDSLHNPMQHQSLFNEKVSIPSLKYLNLLRLKNVSDLWCSELPSSSISKLEELKVINCTSLRIMFHPSMAGDLVNLKQLLIHFCSNLEAVVGKKEGVKGGYEREIDKVDFPRLERLDIQDLPNLVSLFPNVHTALPKSTDSLHNPMQPQSLFNEKVSIPNLKYLNVLGLKNVSDLWCSELPSNSISKLEELKVTGCTSLRIMFHPSMAGGLVNLKQLHIHFCSTLEAVVGKEEGVKEGYERETDKVEFPRLERLDLKDLPNLVSLVPNENTALLKSTDSLHNPMQPQSLFNEKVSIPSLKYLKLHWLKNVNDLWCSELPSSSISKLEELKVISCTSLRIMFRPSMAGGLVNLKQLLIHFCSTLEAVIGKEEAVKEGYKREINKVEFPQLERLDLHDLPNLVSLFPNVNTALPKSTDSHHHALQPQSLFNEKVSIPSLKYLKLHWLKNVSDLWCSELPSSSISKLEELKVISCTSLRIMFRPSMAGGLVNLKQLLIHFCSTLEAVVGEEEGVKEGYEREIDKVEFPRLERLDLKNLRNLVSLFPNVSTALPQSTDSLHNPMQHQSLFNEKVSIPSLKYLNLLGLKNVSNLWCSELPGNSISKLQELKVTSCTSLRIVFHLSIAGGLVNLKKLLIHFCSTLEAVVGEEEGVKEGYEREIDKVEFPRLERLDLKNLRNLVSLFPNVSTALPKSTDSLHNPMQHQSLFNEKVSIPSLKYLNLIGLKNVRDLWCNELPSTSIFKLKELKVTSCTSLRIMFHPSVAGGLVNLKQLLIHFCSTMEAVVGKEEEGKEGYEREIDKVEFPRLERLDLQHLPNLVSLFPNVNTALPKSTDSHHHPLQPQSLFNEKVSIPSLKYLNLLGLENVSDLWCSELPSRSISKLEELRVTSCTSLRIMFHPSVAGGLVNLKQLLIHFCSTLEAVVGKEEEVKEGYEREINKVEFPRLERLDLHDLPNLVSLFPNENTALPKSTNSHHHPMQPQSLFNEKVSTPSLKYLKLHWLKNVSDLWCSELPSSSISKLEELKVISCTSLKIMIRPSMAGGLVNLKQLLIHFCSTLEAVVGKEGVKEGYEREIDKIEFPRLERLDLHDLPNLVSLFPNENTALPKSTDSHHHLMQPQSLFNEKVSTPSLKYLKLHWLKNVSDLWCSELPSSSISKLEELKVLSCTSLRIMFRPSMAGGLVNLKQLLIHFCSTLEAVVGKEEGVKEGYEREIDKVEFPRLERLDLHDLPNLVSLFLNENTALPKSADSHHHPLQPQSLFNEKVSTPSLKYLKLHWLKNVSDLWCSELPSSSISKLEELKVISCTSLRIMFRPSMAGGLVNLKQLLIHFCSTLEAVVGKEGVKEGYEREIDKVEFPRLERLDLHDLPNLVSLFPNENTALPKSADSHHHPMQPQSLFNEKVSTPSLKYLKLHWLKNVSDLWCSELPSSSISKLEELKVISCTSLRIMFRPSMAGGLVNLKQLLIHFCSTLEVVVGKEGVKEGYEREIDKVEFPRLERLDLHDLPNLVSLFPNENTALPKSADSHHHPMQPQSLFNEKVSTPSLKYLKLHWLKNVTDLWCSELPSSSISKLEELRVISCTSLRIMFRPSMAGGLVNLKQLLIHFCSTLEAVVGKEEEVKEGYESSIHKVEFPRLERLDLQNLPNLVTLFPNVNTGLPKSTDSLHNPLQPQSLFNEKVSIPSLKCLKLQWLKNVSDLWCNELPSSSISKLEELKVIGCTTLRIIFRPSMVGGFVNLKQLLIHFCSTLEAVVGKEERVKEGYEREIDNVEFLRLERLDLQDLPNLVSLFPNVSTALPKSIDSHHHPLQPQSLFNQKVSIPSLKYLKLHGLKNVSDLWCSKLPSSSISKLEELKVNSCTSLRIMFRPSMAGGLVNLKQLLIHFCSTLEAVVSNEGGVNEGYEREIDKVEFPRLERLDLQYLPNLVSLFSNMNTTLPKSTDSLHNPMQHQSLFNEKVSIPNLMYLNLLGLKNVSHLWCSELPSTSISKLKELKVTSCTSLRIMFHPSVAGGLVNLKRLLIHFCATLEAVVGKEEEGKEGYEIEIDKVEFPRLERLDLQDLPNLVSLFPNVYTALPKSTDSLHNPMQSQSLFNEKVSIPSLKYLNLLGLMKVSDLWCNELPSSSFSKLEELKVTSCTSLRNMFHPSVAGGLVNLKQLLIHFCSTLEAVVGKEEEGKEGYEKEIDKVKFPRLERLDLQDLPNLVSLFPNVSSALPKSTDTLHNLMQHQSLFNKKVSIPSLKYLKLHGLKNVRDLWCSELPSSSISKLEELKVNRCTSLRIMFRPSMAGGLVNLKQLLIHFCSTLEAVVGKEEGLKEGYEREIDKVEFPRLKRLDLQDLPNLVSLFPNENTDLPKSTDSLHNPMQPQSLFNEKVSIPSLKYLKLHWLKNVSDLWCSELPSSSISKLEELKVTSCTSLRIMFHPSVAGGLVNLKQLLIHFCSTLEAVVGNQEGVKEGYEREIHKVEFPRLERLDLEYLPNLVSLFPNVNTALPKSTDTLHNPMQHQSLFNEKVSIPSLKYLNLLGLKNVSNLWCSELPGNSISKLKELKVTSCTSLRIMFHPSVAGGLVNLKQLLIHFCSTLEAVVGKEEEGYEREIDKVEFPRLERLDLQDLPNLVSLFPNVNTALPNSTDSHHHPLQPQSLFNEKVSIPSLKYLNLLGLKNVSDLWCSELPSNSISKLKELKVSNCTSLRIMFHPSVAGGLVNLKLLLIHFCSTLEAVVGKEEEGYEREIDKVEFPRLERLDLQDLPNLVSLFPNVNTALPKSTDSHHHPLQPRSLFNEKVSIPSLKYLNLLGLKNVSDLWCSELPSNSISKLKELKVSNCTSLRIMFHPSVAGGLVNLKLLLIHFCSTLEAVVGKEEEGYEREIDKVEFPRLERLDLQDIPNLVSLFPNVNTALPKSTDSHHHPLQPQSLFNEKVSIPSLKYLNLLGLKNVSDLWCSELPSNSISKLKELKVSNCTSLRIMFHPSVAGGLVNLKLLLIHFCSNLEAVVGKEEEVKEGYEREIDKVEFPRLERLDFQDLPNLVSLFPNVNTALPKSTDSHHHPLQHQSLFNEKVSIPCLKYLNLLGLKNVSDLWCSELPSSSFSKLEKLEVISCTSLRIMFHPSMAGGLVNMKELLIRFCSTLEAVVGVEEEVKGGYEREIDKVEFPQLERLELHDLLNFVSFFPNVNTALPKSTDSLHNPMQSQSIFNEKVSIRRLKYLKLLGLKNVSNLWCSELPSSSFSKLEKLEVISCTSLRIMFHPSMVGGLVNLKELLIEVCSTLELVVGKEEEVVRGGHGSKIDKTLFPLLGKLKLGSLPNMKRFCNSSHPLELPKLSKMDILFCPSMDAFSSEPVCAPNLTLQGISWNGDLNNAIQFLQKNGNDPMARSMEKPRTLDDVTDKFKPWQVAKTQCRLVAMPDSTDGAHKVVRLIYTNSGDGILALGCNGIIRLWKWGGGQHNPSGMATASVVPQQWQPASGFAMTNDVIGAKLEEAVPCIALVKNDSEVFSACGGVISLFNMKTFKVMKKFMPPPPTSTFLALSPWDNNLIAIGREDSTICTYNVMKDKVIGIHAGHQKHITGLAFSTNLEILVSSGADAQLCAWSAETGSNLKSVPMRLPAGKARNDDTRVQFHSDQIHLLVSHETQLAIYDVSKMDQIRQWVPQDVLPAPISSATYSCDCQLVYASFCNGHIGLFDADSLTLRCYIEPSVYLSPTLSSGSQAVYPLVVAAHPQQPNQFAIGLTNGSVIVMELPTITVSSSNASNQTPDPVLDEDVDGDLDEDALITTRTRTRTATAGTHDDEEDLEEVLDEDVDEDALITTRTRTKIATTGTHDDKEDLEEKRKKEEEEEERKKKKGKAPLLDEDEEY